MAANMTTHSVCCRLSRDPAQVSHAREQAREALSRWGLGEHADLAELIVNELATNAIRHGHGVVHVCVSYANGDLRVDVHDDGAGRPARQQATPDDESGRGLALLDGLIGLHGGRRGVANDITGHGKTAYVMIGPLTDPAGVPVTGASAACAPTAHRDHAGKPSGLADRPHGAASWPSPRRLMCHHAPPCPAADAADREAARVIAFHPEQGWSLLCNGIVTFDDTGGLLPDGTVIEPHRAASRSPGSGLLPNEARPRGAPCRTDAPVREDRAGLRDHCPVRRGPRQSTSPRRQQPPCEAKVAGQFPSPQESEVQTNAYVTAGGGHQRQSKSTNRRVFAGCWHRRHRLGLHQAARARIRGVIVDTSRHVQSVYVPVGDGVRLAVESGCRSSALRWEARSARLCG